MGMMTVQSKIIIALDFDDEKALLKLIDNLDPQECRLKIGKTFFTQYGPQWVQKLQQKGFEIFLDLKFHDIPAQVKGACQQAAKLGVWMVNVHALGGLKMLQAAKAGVDSVLHSQPRRPLLIGVTLLTSLSQGDLIQMGFKGNVDETVMRLATLCYEAGLDGVVCSAHEVQNLKKAFGQQFICVTPGIRLLEDDSQDQQRIMTPESAIASGSDYLVIGRSITHAPLPSKVLQQINQSIR